MRSFARLSILALNARGAPGFGETTPGELSLFQSIRSRLGSIWTVFQNVSRLTVERSADFVQCLEAHAFHLSRFEKADVRFGDADMLREIA